MATHGYARAMAVETPLLVLEIDTKLPVELVNFVGSFTSLSSHYQRYIRTHHPELKKDAEIYVREVRHGSFVADLIPFAPVFVGGAVTAAADAVGVIDAGQILHKFVTDFQRKLNAFKSGNRPDDVDTLTELKDWQKTVETIATDPDAKQVLSSATFKDGKREIEVSFHFDTSEARKAEAIIEESLLELGERTHPLHERVLMMFVRAGSEGAGPNKKTGERALISSLHPMPLSVIYASEIAGGKIQHELKTGEYPFDTGFVVDAYVETGVKGKPVAFRVARLHETIDLREEDNADQS